MSLLCHSCPSEPWVTIQSQKSQLDTECECVWGCVIQRVKREKEIIFISKWLHLHTSFSGPQGWYWRPGTVSTIARAHMHTQTLTNAESQTEREFGRAATVKWMRGKVAHHCSRWLAHFHFNYTAQWHCRANTQARAHTYAQMLMRTTARTRPVHVHTLRNELPISHFSEPRTGGCRHKARRTGTDC